MSASNPQHPRAVDRAASWTLILGIALGLRVIAAALLTWYVGRKGTLCLFADTNIYWELARTIVEGEPYRVSQWGVPHYALRTPGYPLFLAACRAIFGPSLPAVRLVQAGLGVLGVWLVARLAASTIPSVRRSGSGWTVPLVAAALAAIDPYIVGMSALVLSEALFLPLMLAGLWGLARLWRSGDEPTIVRPASIAIGTGLAMGGAILARPSWALFLPGVLGAWVLEAGRGRRVEALRRALIVGVASAAILAPWWARNARIFGRFVPTALWVGASLYDGIGPQANGESDMRFVDEPDVRALGESEQDAVFRERSIAFARSNPRRVLALAGVKFGRFWSPWPNADALKSPGVALASALITIPVYLLIGLGIWDRRRDPRALVLLAGPLLYFCLLHMVFVSSIRYRIPGEVPALGLAAAGLGRLMGGRSGDE
ncbi:ArnT family glycosyltransferase [Tundrisphaera lichenicola]|uniref:ArnT family glycosyltransferase n=1 Tax=Tundrisphaera lichenicola TaxID=2029860 RepID=UPI003EBB75DE